MALQKNKQAMKRHRQNLKRRELNKHVKSTTRSRIKLFMEAIDQKDKAKAQESYKEVQSQLAKAARKGVLHRSAASRKSSRLATKLNQLSAEK